MIRVVFLFLALIIALVVGYFIYATNVIYDFSHKKVFYPMLLVFEADNGKTIDISLGAPVRVVLPENASTGYRWTIDRYDEEFIEAVATEPHYPAGAVGSGGEVEFIFKSKKIGSGEIRLKQWRHWEGDSSIINRYQLRLNVCPLSEGG